jgi:hypothetical protein
VIRTAASAGHDRARRLAAQSGADPFDGRPVLDALLADAEMGRARLFEHAGRLERRWSGFDSRLGL